MVVSVALTKRAGADADHAVERAGEVPVTGKPGRSGDGTNLKPAGGQQPFGHLQLQALQVLLGADADDP